MEFQRRPRIRRRSIWDIYQELSRKRDDNTPLYTDGMIYRLLNRIKETDGSPERFEQINAEWKDGNMEIRSKSPRIKTLEDLIQHCEINLDEWQIDRHVINKWEVGAKDADDNLVVEPLFQVKAWLEPKTEETNLKTHLEGLLSDIEALSPKVSPITYPDKEKPCLAEISIFDIHFGKLAWKGETGENYDSKIAKQRSMNAFDDLLRKALRNDIEQFLIVIGNDELHIDSMREETTSGTPQHTDSRWQEMANRMIETRIAQIDKAKQYAPVQILVVPGNHDEMLAQLMGRELRAYYRNDANVQVDCSPKLTKYYKYGTNMLMFNHGKDIKPDRLPYLMAVKQPQMWSETTNREVHIGHLHKRAKMVRHEDEDAGVIVRVLPSLCGTDYWHAKKGYVGNVKAAQCFVYGKESGLEEILQYNEPDIEPAKQSGFNTVSH